MTRATTGAMTLEQARALAVMVADIRSAIAAAEGSGVGRAVIDRSILDAAGLGYSGDELGHLDAVRLCLGQASSILAMLGRAGMAGRHHRLGRAVALIELARDEIGRVK